MKSQQTKHLATHLGQHSVAVIRPMDYAPVFGALAGRGYPRPISADEKPEVKEEPVSTLKLVDSVEATPEEPDDEPKYKEIRASSPPLLRLALRTRVGGYWNFPYHYMGLIECNTPSRIVIHCNSGEISAIEIEGAGLDGILAPLGEHRLVEVRETDNLLFSTDEIKVETIRLVRGSRKEKDQAGFMEDTSLPETAEFSASESDGPKWQSFNAGAESPHI